MVNRGVGALMAVGLALAAGGCTSHKSPVSSAPSSPPLASGVASPTPSTATGAQNLVVTDAIRLQLRTAAAELNNLTASDYTGLVPGETYYAYDASTQTYWAGAGLVPSSASERAQVSVQDDGSYYLFRKSDGGAWRVWSVGLTGTEIGGKCPIAVPADVLEVWRWKAGTCRAPSS